ncbi:hypothetical protein [Silvibacterium dinghuense]|uniref:Uncharacterized protein n=1 Tax=Silvibacterium dinghuense TaxID=1560006 RepID=A0A4V1NVV6_9BACT|nr:hypothetical protein [Silvibacterium dinghuense]RXS97252.1 hypothetical protein ESZ00_04890 [Silvibacterium dinghuense]GGG97480.1 hypothetical protein GCM10011586_10960 [Silvibacterium dinghuense]
MRWVIGVVVLGVICWLGWAPLRALLFGGRISYANSPKGQWVGEIEITGGYNANMPGYTWPHKKAAIAFTLSVEDRFVDRYGGSGELFLQGEANAHPIRIGSFDVSPVVQDMQNGKPVYNGQRVKMVLHILNPSNSADDPYEIKGQYTPDGIIFDPDDSGDLKLQGKIQRGNNQTYNQIRQHLMTAAPNP